MRRSLLGGFAALLVAIGYAATIPLFKWVGAPPSTGEAWFRYLPGKTATMSQRITHQVAVLQSIIMYTNFVDIAGFSTTRSNFVVHYG
jgi:hypothetical protein